MNATNMMRILASLFLLLALGLATFPVRAQATEGVILGTVRDATGASVPGVRITVTNLNTGLSRTVRTNEVGDYVVPNLPIGRYKVEAEMEGFKKSAVTDIVLTINERVRVDLTLEVGAITEAVTIVSEAPLVRTDSAEIGQVIDQQKIVDLPLNGRNFLQLAQLIPGVTPGQPNDRRAVMSGMAINAIGSRTEGNYYMLDGISNMETFISTFNIVPSIDAIQEFKVQTSQYSAEFGSASGAVVNIATKSGTNDLHGTVFAFVRNDNLDARNFFAARKPEFKRNQFGITAGGPIRRNRSFFFTGYEGTRIREGLSRLGIVPTAEERRGDFSRSGYTIYDPLTLNPQTQERQPFPGNVIPPDRINPISRKILDFWPLPNRPGPFNYLFAGTVRDDADQAIVRLDHTFSEKDSIFGRYIIQQRDRQDPGMFPTGVTGTSQDERAQNFVFTWNHGFGPTASNEFRFGYNYTNFNTLHESVVRDYVREFGIPVPPQAENNKGFPQISVAGLTSLRPVGAIGVPAPFNRKNHTFQFLDHFTLIRGSHTLKSGVDVRRIRQANFQGWTGGISLSFNGQYTGPRVGSSALTGLADFLLGFPASGLGFMNNDFVYLETTQLFLFLADDWKAAKNLTLNLGVRYELQWPWAEIYGRMANIDYSRKEMVYLSKAIPYLRNVLRLEPDRIPYPHRFVDRETLDYFDKNNIAPRLGFAYRLFGSTDTVLRGGYGIFYDVTTGNSPNEFGNNAPFNWTTATVVGDLAMPNFRIQDGIPGDLETYLKRFPFFESHDENFVKGYVQKWSLGIQRRLAAAVALDVSYVGQKGTKLPRIWKRNRTKPGPGPVQPRRPIPWAGDVTNLEDSANSTYHALQLSLETQRWHGLSLLAAYTYGKAITDSDGLGGPGGMGGALFTPPYDIQRLDKSLASYDFRQRLSLSFLYELPFPERIGGIARTLFGGWQLNGIVVFQSGFWVPVRLVTNVLNDGVNHNRPDRVCDGNLPPAQRKVERWFDVSCFAVPALYTFGNAGRNIIETPGTKLADIGLFKNFLFGERYRLQFRTEFFNAFNHPNFLAPDSLFPSPTTGRISSAYPGRQIQFGLKFLF